MMKKTVRELKKICKNLGIKGYNKMRKKELIKVIKLNKIKKNINMNVFKLPETLKKYNINDDLLLIHNKEIKKNNYKFKTTDNIVKNHNYTKNDLLQDILEKNILSKLKRKPRKNTQRYLIIEFLKKQDLTMKFKLQSVISYIETIKIFSDRKRSVAHFFNELTNGYWLYEIINKDKYIKFDLNYNKNLKNINKCGTFFKKKNSKKIIERAHFRCEICRNSIKEVSHNIDHIIPRSKGGNGTVENGALLCQQCNNRKKENDIEHTALSILKDLYKLKNRVNKNISFDQFLTNIKQLNN